jgi:hypothetical protein
MLHQSHTPKFDYLNNPARSPDLTPLVYVLRERKGYRFYRQKLQASEEILQRSLQSTDHIGGNDAIMISRNEINSVLDVQKSAC